MFSSLHLVHPVSHLPPHHSCSSLLLFSSSPPCSSCVRVFDDREDSPPEPCPSPSTTASHASGASAFTGGVASVLDICCHRGEGVYELELSHLDTTGTHQHHQAPRPEPFQSDQP
ncbi:hypothetical protein YC2023_033200 [Brassica napus]